MLNLALVGVRHARAGHGLGVRARAPHARDLIPVALVVLHLGPDEVVARRSPSRSRSTGSVAPNRCRRSPCRPASASASRDSRPSTRPARRTRDRTSRSTDRRRLDCTASGGAVASRRCRFRPARPAEMSLASGVRVVRVRIGRRRGFRRRLLSRLGVERESQGRDRQMAIAKNPCFMIPSLDARHCSIDCDEGRPSGPRSG